MRALNDLDPATWGLPLSPEGARDAWRRLLRQLARARAAPAPTGARTLLVIGSANVYTASFPWAWSFGLAGWRVRVKLARGTAGLAAALRLLPGVEAQDWRGGDLAAEARAMHGVDAVLAFGAQETMDALRARVPAGVPFLPFGPRFGAAVVPRVGLGVVRDHALYDSRGCMTPSAVFVARHELGRTLACLRRVADELPPGQRSPGEAAEVRTHLARARMLGQVHAGAGWALAVLPPTSFVPRTLPRVLTVHPVPSVGEAWEALRPHAALLGTVATPAGADVPPFVSARVCRPGTMQTPRLDGWHDGVDVFAAVGARR